ncbi:MAG: TRCF domain-containing protein, partial [Pseudomonadota bacterium]
KKILSDAAEKRLRVLASLDSLGGGFTLASHDMDIRGAGNLLGSEQSGHIKEVGFELYQQMLEEALANLKSGDEAVDLGQGNKSPQINIGVSAIIPENYVTDLSVRMGLYRRLADIENSADIENFAAELIDRFGKLPSEVNNLLNIIILKNACRKAHIAKFDAGEKGMLITFYNDHFPQPEKLLLWIQEKKGKAKMRPDHRLALSQKMLTTAEKFKISLKVITQIGKLTEIDEAAI